MKVTILDDYFDTLRTLDCFLNWTPPAAAAYTFCRSGISLIQAPHQLAQKLRTIGLPPA